MPKVKNNKQANNTPTLAQEVMAVLGVFFAVFLSLAFFSYNYPSEGLVSDTAGNWAGKIGFFIAHISMSLLGLSSFWLIFLLTFFACKYFLKKDSLDRLPYSLLGSTGILISSSSLFAAYEVEQFLLVGHTYPGAGFIGRTFFKMMQPFLGTPGFILFFSFLLLLSLMVAIRFSPYGVVCKFCESAVAIKEKYQLRKKENKPGKVRTVKSQEGHEDVKVLDIVGAEPKVNEPPVPKIKELQEEFHPLPVAAGDFVRPSFKLLEKPKENKEAVVDRQHFIDVSKTLESKLLDFGVQGKVVGISPGPVVTTYEFAPAAGVKISKVVSLEDDLALVLKSQSVRIVGSVPGKAALGIEIPNPIRQNVFARDIIATDKFHNSGSVLTLGLGKDVIGNPVLANLAKMPHLLIAGATGAGKSVGINTIICSMLFKATPEELRLLLVDPKRVELMAYDDIPHLLHPVVADPKMASRALQWAVMEMERRYGLMEQHRVKNIESYNQVAEEKLPLIVIIIDELADLMMVASKDVESSVARLAQMARAAGMHLILATQRPSVDVLTGLIKANFPTRISFKVSSKIDSRTIIDASGAEHLLGDGDMLMVPPGSARMQRIHGAYISEKEVERIVNFLKEQRDVSYDESVLKIAEEDAYESGTDEPEEYDEKYDEAVALVCETGQASISMVQRRLRVGYNRAARMIEVMEREGVVGPADGAKLREVLVRQSY